MVTLCASKAMVMAMANIAVTGQVEVCGPAMVSSDGAGLLFLPPGSHMVSFIPEIATHKLYSFKHCLLGSLALASYWLTLSS